MMNKKTFKHPETREVRTTRDFLTARALLSQGWREVQQDAPVKQGEAKKS